MDINVNIPSPILLAGQSFGVEYRLLPSGAWVDISPKTNAPFTITGLAAGKYELKYYLVLSNGYECQETIQTFEVINPDSCDCPTTVAAAVRGNGDGYLLDVTYTLPLTQPCGWTLSYGGVGMPKTTINYSSLPSGGLTLPAIHGNVIYEVKLVATCCNGLTKDCTTITSTVAPCTPVVLDDVYIVKVGDLYYLHVIVTNSVPVMTSVTVTYGQSSFGVLAPVDSGSKTVPLPPNHIVIQLNPNTNPAPYPITYFGNFNNGCGGVIKFQVSV